MPPSLPQAIWMAIESVAELLLVVEGGEQMDSGKSLVLRAIIGSRERRANGFRDEFGAL